MSSAKASGPKVLWFVAFLAIAALWLRMAYIQDAPPVEKLIKDARQYADYGFNLVQHATFSLERNSPAPKPDSFRSPGYPLLIALSIQAGGDRGFYPLMLYYDLLNTPSACGGVNMRKGGWGKLRVPPI